MSPELRKRLLTSEDGNLSAEDSICRWMGCREDRFCRGPDSSMLLHGTNGKQHVGCLGLSPHTWIRHEFFVQNIVFVADVFGCLWSGRFRRTTREAS